MEPQAGEKMQIVVTIAIIEFHWRNNACYESQRYKTTSLRLARRLIKSAVDTIT